MTSCSQIYLCPVFFFLGFMTSVETIRYWKMDWCVVDFGLSIGTVNNNKKIDTRFILFFFSPISYMIVCVWVIVSVEQCSNVRVCIFSFLCLVIVIQLSPAPAPSQRAGIIQSIALSATAHLCPPFHLPCPPLSSLSFIYFIFLSEKYTSSSPHAHQWSFLHVAPASRD